MAGSKGAFKLTITEPPSALATAFAFLVLVLLILWWALFFFR
jgi:hypothetical protein